MNSRLLFFPAAQILTHSQFAMQRKRDQKRIEYYRNLKDRKNHENAPLLRQRVNNALQVC